MSAERSPLSVGVVVPCRNEARVVRRRLANLARIAWPPGGHRAVVVDDGSDDDTLALARSAAGEIPFPPAVRVEVVPNEAGDGKAGAVRTGIAHLSDVDLVLLTDADVVFAEDALSALAAAFEAEPELGMACGGQDFVRDLAEDGRPLGADGGPPVPAGGRYDRFTAGVRRLESRSGRLFSVHGQCLAWRRSLGLAPTPGVAADDLDLMLQARARGARVRLVAGARFLEVKSAPGPAREDQALRRARAYFQVFERAPSARAASLGRGVASLLQWAAYRYLPAATPRLLPVLLAAAGLLAWAVGGAAIFILVLAAALALALSPFGRSLVRLLAVVERARRSRAPGGDRWEMQRP